MVFLEWSIQEQNNNGFRNTVEPHLTKTAVIRSPRYYVHFFLAAQEDGHTFSGKNKTLVNTVTR